MWIYLNDRFVPEEEAKISVFDHGLLYGDGLFETFRAYAGAIFRLPQHLDRLARSASRLSLALPSASALKKSLYESLERNNLGDAILRLTLTRGEGALGLDPDLCERPTLVIIPRAFSGYPSDHYTRGVSAVLVRVRRNPTAAQDPSLKSISFLNNVEAKMEAKRRGAFEGIFLNLEGYLSEGTISNLFWVRKEALRTPSLEAGLLDGITRRVVLELAEKEGVPIREGSFLPSDLFEADEAFLTNTGLELAPLTRVDGEKIGAGLPGPITSRLHQAFKEEVRRR